MHNGCCLEELGISHQVSVRNHGLAEGEGGHVSDIVTEGSEDQKGSRSKSVCSGDIDKIGPSAVLFKDGVEPRGEPDPPSQSVLVQTLGAQGSKEVASGPRVVVGVERGGQFAVSVPSFGVNNVVEL